MLYTQVRNLNCPKCLPLSVPNVSVPNVSVSQRFVLPVFLSDCSLPECIADGYQLLNSAPEYQKFKKDVPFIDGTWDDHDFGVNDGGREFRHKRESQSLLLDFLDVPKDSPRRLQEGVFTYRIFSIPDKEGLPPRRVKIILLDTRSQREQPWLPSLSEYHLPLGSIISAVLRMLTSIAGSVKLKFC